MNIIITILEENVYFYIKYHGWFALDIGNRKSYSYLTYYIV